MLQQTSESRENNLCGISCSHYHGRLAAVRSVPVWRSGGPQWNCVAQCPAMLALSLQTALLLLRHLLMLLSDTRVTCTIRTTRTVSSAAPPLRRSHNFRQYELISFDIWLDRQLVVMRNQIAAVILHWATSGIYTDFNLNMGVKLCNKLLLSRLKSYHMRTLFFCLVL